MNPRFLEKHFYKKLHNLLDMVIYFNIRGQKDLCFYLNHCFLFGNKGSEN